MRRALEALAVFLFGLFVPAALAGDRALSEIIGYSEDGRYFAFEEFGIQDGSGFPYANVYVIDLSEDSWVSGTPLRHRTDDETAPLSSVRAAAREAAGLVLGRLGIDWPAEIWALVGDGDLGADAGTLRFGVPGYTPGAVIGEYELVLETFEAPPADTCDLWFDQPILGYALTLVGPGGARLVHRDTGVPRSRGCPFAYRLHGVVAPFQAQDASDAVALVSVYPGGFEGPDRRFLAVPLGE